MEHINIDLPYITCGDEFAIEYKPHDIEPLNENKRIRVFGGQLTDTIIDNTKLDNFNWNIGLFFKFGRKLIKKFPHREIELNRIMVEFWQRMQIRYKQLSKN